MGRGYVSKFSLLLAISLLREKYTFGPGINRSFILHRHLKRGKKLSLVCQVTVKRGIPDLYQFFKAFSNILAHIITEQPTARAIYRI